MFCKKKKATLKTKKFVIIRTRSLNLPIYRINIELDDDSESTYLVTPNRYCQNPSHAHHYSHQQSGYRYPVAHTVVEETNPEESTGGSIVTVINNTMASIKANDSTPDIVLTNSETDTQIDADADANLTIATATRSLSIQSNDNGDDMADPSTSSAPTVATSQATDTISNDNNEAGTGSLQINKFECESIANTPMNTGNLGQIYITTKTKKNAYFNSKYTYMHTYTYL